MALFKLTVAVGYIMNRHALQCMMQIILFCRVAATNKEGTFLSSSPVTSIRNNMTRSSIFDIEPRSSFSSSSSSSYLRGNSESSSSSSLLPSLSSRPLPPSGEESSTPTTFFDTSINQTQSLPFNNIQRPSIPRTSQELQQEQQNKRTRIKARRELAKEKMRQMIENPHEFSTKNAEKMSEEEIQSLRDDLQQQDPELLQRPEGRWLWNLAGSGSSKKSNIADPSAYWDKWAQAFRMLGVYLECANSKSQWMYYGGGGNGGNKNNNNGNDYGCKRWVLWAAYVNPNYQGYGINEYVVNWVEDDDYYGRFAQYSSGGCQRNDNNGGEYKCYNQQTSRNNKKNNKNAPDEPISKLDCHFLDTEWLILGVYRENFYDYFEQITKHLWYYNSYEYKIASSGLQLINDECEGAGVDKYGNYLYRAPKPVQGGGFVIGLYTDDSCMTPSQDNGMDYGYGYSDDSTLELFNQIFEEFKYCTLCIDYPSYQDGYFNGDGYDEDDLINQCWKFYSHDTYECDSSCMASADAQGTINAFIYGSKMYGTKWDGSLSGSTKKSSSFSYSLFAKNNVNFKEHFLVNMFLIASCLIFALAIHMFYNAEGNYFGDYFNKKESGLKSRLQSLLDKPEKDQTGKATNRGAILNIFTMQPKSVEQKKKQPAPIVKVQSENKQRTNIIVVGSNKRLGQNEPPLSNNKPNKVKKVFIKDNNNGVHGDYAPPKRKPKSDDASKVAIAILSKKRIPTYPK